MLEKGAESIRAANDENRKARSNWTGGSTKNLDNLFPRESPEEQITGKVNTRKKQLDLGRIEKLKNLIWTTQRQKTDKRKWEYQT